MKKRKSYINLLTHIFCILTLSLLGCTQRKKAEIGQGPQSQLAETEELQRLKNREKDFSLVLEDLKRKNPFTKDHSEIYKYKFTSGTLNLSGVIYDEKRPLAIINGQIVAEGEMVDNKRVIKITPTEVVLKDKEKEYHLKTE